VREPVERRFHSPLDSSTTTSRGRSIRRHCIQLPSWLDGLALFSVQQVSLRLITPPAEFSTSTISASTPPRPAFLALNLPHFKT
jgi:hypothetical protein